MTRVGFSGFALAGFAGLLAFTAGSGIEARRGGFDGFTPPALSAGVDAEWVTGTCAGAAAPASASASPAAAAAPSSTTPVTTSSLMPTMRISAAANVSYVMLPSAFVCSCLKKAANLA